MSFTLVKPTAEYLEETGAEVGTVIMRGGQIGWVYRDKWSHRQLSTGTYATKELLLEYGKIRVWS